MRPEYYDRAVAEYEAALAKDPGSVVIRLAMMELFAGTNRLSKAVALADEILEKDAENVEVRRLLGGIYRGYYGRDRQSPKKEYLEKAIEQFEKLVELEPDNPANHLDLGRLKVLAGDPRTATEILRRAVELEPGNLDARVSLAYLLLERGRIGAAITELERVVEQGSTSRQHLNALAGAYEQAGRTEDAAELYERLIREGGKHVARTPAPCREPVPLRSTGARPRTVHGPGRSGSPGGGVLPAHRDDPEVAEEFRRGARGP